MAREVKTIVVAAVKGAGKTHETIRMLMDEYVPSGRKVLYIDINGEVGNYPVHYPDGRVDVKQIKRLRIKDVPLFSAHPKIEARRVVPVFNDDGSPASEEETERNILNAIQWFQGGCIVLEDLNVVFGDSMPQNITGLLTNNRHRDSDVIIHLQSVGRVLPKIYQNTNSFRIHHQLDNMDDSKHKLKSRYEIFKIAQLIIDKEYFAGNKRFFLFVDADDNKIRGAYSKLMMVDAIKQYLSTNQAALNEYLNKKDPKGKKMYNYQQATKLATQKLFKQYYGN